MKMEHFKRNQSLISSSPLMGEGRVRVIFLFKGDRLWRSGKLAMGSGK